MNKQKAQRLINHLKKLHSGSDLQVSIKTTDIIGSAGFMCFFLGQISVTRFFESNSIGSLLTGLTFFLFSVFCFIYFKKVSGIRDYLLENKIHSMKENE